MRQAMKLWILGVLVACPVAAGPVYLEPEVFYTLHMLQLRDPWWRPLSPFGQSAGVGYGTVPPTFATVGENPGSGELFVDMNAGAGGAPQLQIFDGTSWGAVGTVVGGAVLANANVFTGVNTFNRTAAGVDANFGGAEGDANSISIDGDLGCIKFEGASADAAETHLCGDGAPDGGLFLRNGAAASPSFLNIFNTYTDASNNEGLLITWAGPNIAEILTTAAGTGVRRDLRLLANGSYLNLTSAGAAGASGTFAEFNTVLNIMNGTDTQNVVAINPTGANHTGASNIFNALSVGAIAQDADASERGVSVTGGSESWDASLSFVKGSATDFGRIHWFDGAASRALIMVDASDLHVRAQSADLELYGEDGIHFESNNPADNFIFNPKPNAAGDGSTFATIQATLGIMDGSDTVNALAIDLTNANHTGATNVLNAINISTIVADVDATETAISVGLGGAGATQWDVGLDVTGIVEAGSANKIAVKLPNLGIMGNTAISTWYIGTGTGGCTNFTNLGSGIGFGPSVCNSSAAGSSTTGLFQTGAITLPVMNGSDTWTGFAFNSTNANHTGASNTLNAFAAAAITGDADATEVGVSIGSGWDQGITVPAGSAALPAIAFTADPNTGFLNPSADAIGMSLAGVQNWLFATPPAAGSGGTLETLTATLTAQDGSDTTNALAINLTNANHTGATNVVNAISIGAFTGDAQAEENGILIGSGPDFPLQLPTTGTLALGFTSDLNTGLRRRADNVFCLDAGGTDNLCVDGNAAVQTVVSIRNFPDAVVAVVAGPPAAGASGDIFEGRLAANITAMNGSDAVNGFSVSAFTDANHTSTGNTLNAFSAGAITSPDADALQTGVAVAAGWKQVIQQVGGVVFAGLPATATGQLQMTFCSDCQGAAGVSGAACANGGTGALAISVRNAFICIH